MQMRLTFTFLQILRIPNITVDHCAIAFLDSAVQNSLRVHKRICTYIHKAHLYVYIKGIYTYKVYDMYISIAGNDDKNPTLKQPVLLFFFLLFFFAVTINSSRKNKHTTVIF